jgi:hypothetical protein
VTGTLQRIIKSPPRPHRAKPNGAKKGENQGKGVGRGWRRIKLLNKGIIIRGITVLDLRGSLGIHLKDGEEVIHGLGKPAWDNEVQTTLIRARGRTIQERGKGAGTTIITTVTTQDERRRIIGEITKQGTNGRSQQAKPPRTINTLQARTNQGEGEID